MGKFALIMVASFAVIFAVIKTNLNEINEEAVDTFVSHYEMAAARAAAASAVNIAFGNLVADETWRNSGSTSAFGGIFSISVQDSFTVPTLASNEVRITGTADIGDASHSSVVTARRLSIIPEVSSSMGINGTISSFSLGGSATVSGKDMAGGSNLPGIVVGSSADSAAIISSGVDTVTQLTGSTLVEAISEFPDLSTLIEKVEDNADNYSTDSNPKGTFGTTGTPEITYLQPTSGVANLTGGFRGAGLLAVNADEVSFGGNFSWEGVVIMVGDNVTVRQSGTSSIDGAFMVEANSAVIDITGIFDIAYDSGAVNSADSKIDVHYYYVISWREE